MNYALIYENLMNRAKSRKLTGYKESHHVVPQCLGGPDTKENRVDLTPEEHYLAHQLLVKINPEHKGLKYAAYMMTISPDGRRQNNKLFGWVKRDYLNNRIQSSGMKGKKHKPESIQLMKDKRALQEITETTKAKISKTKTGVKFTKEALKSFNEKRSANQAWIDSNFRPCKESTKSKIGDANRGRVFDKKTCPHCGKTGAGPNMKRYHFDNCKSKVTKCDLPAFNTNTTPHLDNILPIVNG